VRSPRRCRGPASAAGRRRKLRKPFYVTPAHQLLYEVGLLRTVGADVFADVVDGHNVLVGEATHRLRLAHDPLATNIVEALGLDEREGDVAVEQRVVREEDSRLATLAQEAPDMVANDSGLTVASAGSRTASDDSAGIATEGGCVAPETSARAARAIARKPVASSFSESMLNTALAFSATDFQSPELMDVSASSMSASIRRCIRSLGMAYVMII
jgi:hypothetical protein